jgi:hypothetical protein
MCCMKSAILFLACVMCSCCVAQPAPAGQSTPNPISPQSMVGDWEWVINGPVKATLHIKLDANGKLTGVADIPGVPKPVDLSDMHLTGRALTYTMAPMPSLTEPISADGNSMMGAQMWQRVRTTAIPAKQLAGNWEFIGPYRYVLRLRSDANGGLTGKLDQIGMLSFRQTLSEVHLEGNTFTYKMADGTVFQGELSNDGATIQGRDAGSNMLISYTQVATAAQALLDDSNERPMPTDGVWTGIVRTDGVSGPVKPPGNMIHLTFYLKSNRPPACSTCPRSVPQRAFLAKSRWRVATCISAPR